MFYAICNHLYNVKNVNNTHGGVLLLVKLQPLASCADDDMSYTFS